MFLYSKWLALPITTRHTLAKQLGISKTGSTHVQGSQILSDGYAIKDVENAIENSGEDFDILVAKAEGKEIPKPIEVNEIEGGSNFEKETGDIKDSSSKEIIPKKRGRKPKIRA